jgi:hypothetical protein
MNSQETFMPKAVPKAEQGAIKMARLPAFSTLVSGFVLSNEAAKAFDAPGGRPPGQSAEAVEKAWALASSPAALAVAWAMSIPDAGRISFSSPYEDDYVVTRSQRLDIALPEASMDEIESVAAGIEACADDIEQSLGSAGFKKSAASFAKLVAHPVGDEALAYPGLGVALKKSSTVVDGKKAETLAAYELPARGDFKNIVENYGRYSRTEEASPAQWVARAPTEGAEQSGQMVKELTSLRAAIEKGSAAGDDRRLDSEKEFEKFTVALATAKTPWLKGDQSLPSTQVIKNIDVSGPNFANNNVLGSSSGTRGEHVLGAGKSLKHHFQRHVWKSVMSGLLAPERAGQAFGRERALKLSVDGGALAQARLGPWDKNGDLAVSNWVAGSKVFKELAQLLPQEERGRYDEKKNALIFWFKKLAREPEKTRESALALFEKNWEGKVSFGPLGQGLVGVSAVLAGEDARLGLIQWARALNEFSKEPKSWRQDQEEKAPLSPRASRLSQALEKLERATQKFADAVEFEAMEEAQRVEAQWMEKAGWLNAWRQAGSVGEINSKALGWAKANPASAILSSNDPRERMAGLSARALGLRVGADSKALADAMDRALIEQGSSAQGVKLLAAPESEGLRLTLGKLCSQATGSDVVKRRWAKDALPFFCEALAACAQLGMTPAMSSDFASAYVEDLEHFGAGGGVDGLRSTLAPMRAHDAQSAKVAKELSEAKKIKHASFVASLARDWNDTADKARLVGLDEDGVKNAARQRAKELAGGLSSRAALLDWRKVDFDASSAWEVFGLPSPRFTAALADARARGGLAGKFCARAALKLGISDASDGNELIAKTRDVVKEKFGIGDAAWKLAIKSPQTIESIAVALGMVFYADSNDPRIKQNHIDYSDDVQTVSASPREPWVLGSHEKPSTSSADEPKTWDDPHPEKTLGVALMAAVSKNIKPDTATDVSQILTGLTAGRHYSAKGFPLLFAAALPASHVETADDAAFFERELEAKAQRQPKVFQEAARRLEKLVEDAKKPLKEGEAPLNPKNALREELIDLCDWIAGSEAGLWQELPQEPTWGQMRRMSQQWHAEQAAEQADRAARQEVSALARRERQAREMAERQRERDARQANENQGARAIRLAEERRIQEQEKRQEKKQAQAVSSAAQAFAPTAKTAWKAIIGKFERDGWEAVELCTAAALTEEGTTMRHCVSTYASTCREGSCRIFSIRLNGERVSTLQIGAGRPLHQLAGDAKFSLGQNKGRSNAQVRSIEALAFCEDTLKAVQGKWNELNIDWVQEMERIKRLEAVEKEKKAKEAQERLDREIEQRLASRAKPAAGIAPKADAPAAVEQDEPAPAKARTKKAVKA